MLNRSASLAMSTSVLKALHGKLDIKKTHPVFSIDRVQSGPAIVHLDKTDHDMLDYARLCQAGPNNSESECCIYAFGQIPVYSY